MDTTAWASSETNTGWYEWEFNTDRKIEKLRLLIGVDGLSWLTDNDSPAAFRLDVSDTGVWGGEEYELLSVSGLTWSSPEWKEWEFENPYSDRAYYRITITATPVAGNNPALYAIECMECAD